LLPKVEVLADLTHLLGADGGFEAGEEFVERRAGGATSLITRRLGTGSNQRKASILELY
jgi:hypothetical protein